MKKTIIKFEASWCAPCKAYTPVFEKVTNEYKDINVQVIDVDDEPEVAQKYMVMSIPTTLIIDSEGEELTRISGKVDEKTLRKFIDES